MRDDPIVAETRRIRDKLCAKFNYDVKAIFADMRNRQRTRRPTRPLRVSQMQNRGVWLLLLLLSAAQQAFAADPPTGAATDKLASNQGVKELIDTYKNRESKIR